MTGCAAFFADMLGKREKGIHSGIYSVCSANPYVIRAAIEQVADGSAPLLIEATSNQVNQYGGYTGMQPQDFAGFVYGIADECGFPRENIMLGGDHLGPLVWKGSAEEDAMTAAEELVKSYVRAGFTKIHIDTSMKLYGDRLDIPLSDEKIAKRGARLCRAAENAKKTESPVYVIGSEVPVPGGPQEKTDTVIPTAPEAFLSSYRAFEEAFNEEGLSDAFRRVTAFVVQPGVEFTGSQVFEYERNAAAGLFEALRKLHAPLVFECHSTDYQTPESLRMLVEDGAAILKVGPALTYALHRGIIALENIERQLVGFSGRKLSRFTGTLEDAMLKNDGNWKKYYTGTEKQLRQQMRYSYFDRARYYLPEPEVDGALKLLISNLETAGKSPDALLKDSVKQYLKRYVDAVKPV